MANEERSFSEITPELQKLAGLADKASEVDPQLYIDYNVQRGLRDMNGKGVLVGITNISEVNSKRIIDGVETPIPGELFYRGYNVQDIVKGLSPDNHFGFEECIYLLLFGHLPTLEERDEFVRILAGYRSLPPNFVRDVIMKKPSKNMMNSLARSVLTLYSYDDDPDNTSVPNVLRQCMQLIADFPLLSVYGYQSYRHYYDLDSLIIHRPKEEYSTSENILHCLRDDKKFTPLEAKLLDVALILHMEHGGGNNSTFTTHVVSSSGTDTYSSVAASIGSLKGPRHGGANLKVQKMFEDIKANVKDWKNEEEVSDYLQKILDKQAFDRTGLIYGMGHAVYTLSDPREVILKKFAKELAEEKGRTEEFELYEMVERLAGKLIMEHRKLFKNVCANVDFYSGFVYSMLGIPEELFTPIFAIARMPGWSAHRLEELINANKIIRPAYKYVGHHEDFVAMEDRG